MNYRKDFEKCLEYIEEHLSDKLTIPQLAERIGYSHFHFCRLFHIYTGMNPVNYLISRRLEKSLLEIMKGRKILDVALEYGFETASGYSKAFKKVYQMTPKAYAQKMKGYMPHKENESIEEYVMPPRIVEIPELMIEGYGVRVNLDDPNYEEHMGAFWKKYDMEGIEEKLYLVVEPEKHGEIGIMIPKSIDSGEMHYVIGVRASKNGKREEKKFQRVCIPGGKYAVFTTPPVDMTRSDDLFAKMIQKTWLHIFDEWFLSSDYRYDESRYDFEYYDERCHYLANSVMEIYIPIH